MRNTARLAVLVLLAAPPAAWAATVYTVSAQQLDGKISRITNDGRLELVVGGKKSLIPLAKVFRITVQERAPVRPRSAREDVWTVSGTHVCGTLLRSNQALAILSSAVGRAIHLDVTRLLGVKFTRKKGDDIGEERFAAEMARPNKETDVLFVISPKGTVPFNVAIGKIAPDTTAFNWDGEDRSIETARVAAVVFANSPAPGRAQVAARLVDTSVLRGSIISLKGGRLALDLSGTKLAVSMANVVSIELTNPNIVYLSELQPAAVREEPFFPTSFPVWKYRKDKSVGGNPIRLDGRKYVRGIGCHTRTTLTYDIGGQYKKFAAVIGIDDEARPRGSVEFIALADGKKILSKTLTGRDKAVPIALDIAGVKRLALITDFAALASVGDHADWADARIMK